MQAWREPGLSWKELRLLWRRRARPNSSLSSILLASKVWSHTRRDIFVWAWCSAVAKNTWLFPLMQRRGALARMTHRTAMFPGFSNWDGPSNSCQRSEAQSVLEMCENMAAKNVNLHRVFFYSFFQSCLTWRLFGISTCCSLSSHVTGLSHTVGHSANWPFLINHSVPNVTPGLQICNL